MNVRAVGVAHGGILFSEQRADHAAAGSGNAQSGIFSAESSEYFVLWETAAGKQGIPAENRVAAYGHFQLLPCPIEVGMGEITVWEADRAQFQPNQAQVGKSA